LTHCRENASRACSGRTWSFSSKTTSEKNSARMLAVARPVIPPPMTAALQPLSYSAASTSTTEGLLLHRTALGTRPSCCRFVFLSNASTNTRLWNTGTMTFRAIGMEAEWQRRWKVRHLPA
jgi:hypothetical protein